MLFRNNPTPCHIRFKDVLSRENTIKYLKNNDMDNLLKQCKLEKSEYIVLFKAVDINKKTYNTKAKIQITDEMIKILNSNTDIRLERNNTITREMTIPLNNIRYQERTDDHFKA